MSDNDDPKFEVYAAMGAEIKRLEADNARLRAALETIFAITDEEIAVRFRTDSRKTEEQIAGKSAVYSMLSVPRNIARNVLNEKAEKSE